MPQTSAVTRFADRFHAWRPYFLPCVAFTVGLLAALFTLQTIEKFLIHDPRFSLYAEDDQGRQMPGLLIEGLRYAPVKSVRAMFAPDVNRSVYLVPLAARRQNLLGLSWIRDASVARVWPNRLTVRISERGPVAFVPLPPAAARPARSIALIDAEGVLLELPPKSSYALPVVHGVSPEQSIAVRRDRVRRMLRLLQELGPLAAKVSEVDVSEPENLKVTQRIDNRALLLILGNENFAARLQTFWQHYPEIRRRLPEAITLDLRLDDRITAVQQGDKNGD